MNRLMLLAFGLVAVGLAIYANAATRHLHGADDVATAFAAQPARDASPKTREIPIVNSVTIAIHGTESTQDRMDVRRKYVELVARKSERMTDESLDQAVRELTTELDEQDRKAETDLEAITTSLEELIDSNRGTPAADRARRAIDALGRETHPSSPFTRIQLK